MDRETAFWVTDNKYQELARQYEEGIVISAPDRISCDALRGCQCSFCASNVKYYEYRGDLY